MFQTYLTSTRSPSSASSRSPMNFSARLKPVVGGAVAAHADLDRIAHTSGPRRARRLIGGWPSHRRPRGRGRRRSRMPATPVAAATRPASAGKHHLADAVAGHPQRQRGAVGLGRREMNDARDGQRRGDAHGESEHDHDRIHRRQRERDRQRQKAAALPSMLDQRERHAAEADRSSGHRTARETSDASERTVSSRPIWLASMCRSAPSAGR